LKVSLTDTSSNPTNPSNIRLYSTEEQILVCSSFLIFLLKISKFVELLWNFPYSKMSKMEAKMELELEAFHAMN
jgi:hypothetical protein